MGDHDRHDRVPTGLPCRLSRVVRVVRCVLCFFVGHAKGKGHVIAIRIRQNPIAITNIGRNSHVLLYLTLYFRAVAVP